MKFRKLVFVLLFVVLKSNMIIAQDFMMQGWYWDYPKTTAGYNWADTIRTKATALKNAGFTYIWLPPLTRASYGNSSNGYDPKDLYDLGEYGGGATGFGTRTNVNDLITQFNSVGLKAVADVVYNHRDGGRAEQNSALKTYISNYSNERANTGYNPFPYDRMRIILPIGGSTGNGAGDYYFKLSSASAHSRFDNYTYKVYMETNTVGWQNQTALTESEPNGGGDCSQVNNDIVLGVDMNATNESYLGCRTDEFHLNLTASDLDAAGDTIFIYISKRGSSDYSDVRPYGIWSSGRGTDIASELQYQTYTNFNSLPSGQGGMNFENFKPNNTNTTKLDGDWDWLWFFYDYDQNVASTKTALFDWTQWLWNDVGIRGLRMDAVKHFPYEFVGDLLDTLHDNSIDPGMVVGEFYDSGVNNLKYWIQQVYTYMNAGTSSAIQVRLFDFALRQALKDACDSYGNDVRNVFTSGLVDGGSMSGSNAVTFLNNHDFRDEGQAIQNDPILAYAYILINNQIGIPCVFYPDYYNVTSFSNTNLHTKIDKLIEVHKNYIYGASSRDYLTSTSTSYNPVFTTGGATTSLIYQLRGANSGKDVIVAINFAGTVLDCWIGVNTSSLPESATLGDQIGNATLSTLTVSGGRVNIKIPSRSYAVWVEDVAALPVELTEFNISRDGNGIKLNWKTATEVNNYGFAVERSAISSQSSAESRMLYSESWTKIGFVQGHGNSNSPKNYSFVDNIYQNGIYSYRLKQIDFDGKYEYSDVRNVEINDLNEKLVLEQNYPNPFNPKTKISFMVDREGIVSLRIFNQLGQFISEVFNGLAVQNKKYEVEVDASNLSSGVYFYQLVSGSKRIVKQMMILK